jgi:hypothetical protein
MLGLNPLSSAPISDLGALTPITGYISTTDTNDTATLLAFELDNGIIYTTDDNDTATINGTVVTVTHTGTISATDDNDTALLTGTVANPAVRTGGDGWTKKEWEHYKRLDKKRHLAELARIEAFKKDAESRKQKFKDLIDPQPVANKQQNKVQSNQEVSVDIPSIDLTVFDKSIANLDRQKQELVRAVALRQQKAEIEMHLAILEAKRLAELDDEEALLLLL